MGNVQQKGREDSLSQFQRRKLKYDFYTFFDLNNDGCLTYNDFLWAKDKICYMSGWKIDNPKYKITEALFKEIWESLEEIADIDKDGKITKTEWLMMWTAYKREIMAREKEETDFLKKLFDQHKEFHSKNEDDVARAIPTIKPKKPDPETVSRPAEIKPVTPPPDSEPERDDDDDWNVELDSDEEPPSILKAPRPKATKPTKPKATATTATATTATATTTKKPELYNERAVDAPPVVDEKKSETVLEMFATSENQATKIDESRLPKWLFKYLVFRFILLDRTGDNVIDNEEFEYVLSEFGVSERVARQAFTIFTQNNTLVLDFEYFVKLFEQFYLSNDPADLGNFINGKLDYDDDSEDDDPGLLEHRTESTTSIHSMDDDIRGNGPPDRNRPTRKSTIKLHETKGMAEELYKDVKQRCCSIC